MIPLCGVLQGDTFSSSALGGKPASPVKGPSDIDFTASSDNTTGSFLQWVQRLVDHPTPEAPDGERGPDLKMTEDESREPPLDQEQIQVPCAMVPASPVPYAPPALDSGRPDGDLPTGMPDMPTPQMAGSPGDAPSPVVPMMSPPLKDDSIVDGQSPAVRYTPSPLNAGNVSVGQASDPSGIMNFTSPDPDVKRPPVDDYAHRTVSDRLSAGTPTGKVAEGGPRQPDAIGHSLPTEVTDMAGRIGPGQDGQNKADSLGVELPEKTSVKGRGNEKTGYPFQSASPLNDKGQSGNDRFIQQGLADVPGNNTKTNDPVNPNSLPNDGPIRDTETIVSALSDKNTSFREDASTDFNGNGNSKRDTTRRVAVANFNEDDMQKGPTSDSLRNGAPDAARSPLPVPDTAKVMAVDLSTDAADKLTADPTATFAKTDAAATKTFQSTVMDQIVDKAAMRSIHGRSEIRIQLKPEFLGNVQMNIAAEKDQLMVRIVADQTVVKDAIETHLHHLKAELQNQGLAVEKIEVLINPDADPQHSREQASQMFKNNSFANGGRQDEEKNPEKREQPHHGEDNDSSNEDGDGINYFA